MKRLQGRLGFSCWFGVLGMNQEGVPKAGNQFDGSVRGLSSSLTAHQANGIRGDSFQLFSVGVLL